LPAQEEYIQAYRFVTVYRMNFIIFLCVTLKLFSLSFVPLLAPNPGDATATPQGGLYPPGGFIPPWGVYTPKFRTTLLAYSPDNRPNTSLQSVLNVAFTVLS